MGTVHSSHTHHQDWVWFRMTGAGRAVEGGGGGGGERRERREREGWK